MTNKNQKLPADSMYYVYVLIDPRNDQPFYVGKGKGNRVQIHYCESSLKKTDNPRKSAKIKKLKRLGYEPTYKIVFENSNVEVVYEEEKRLIAKWGRRGYDKDGILTNIKLGGEFTPEFCRSVKQYNLFGEYIQTFPSCTAAGNFCGKKHCSSIIKCCRKNTNQKAAWGYFWCYADEELDLDWCFGGKKKLIYQWDLEGNFVNRFVNATEAERYLQKTKSTKEILKSAKTRKTVSHGFRWTFDNKSPGKFVKQPHPKRQAVHQFTIEGEFIKKHASFYEANISLNKKAGNNVISRAIRNKNGIAFGYKWSLSY